MTSKFVGVIPYQAWLTCEQYLLQGSLILLLLADKLSIETNEGVIKACETIVRAHEAAVVTLNTEYQVCSRPSKSGQD